jgi:hypothetical protein
MKTPVDVFSPDNRIPKHVQSYLGRIPEDEARALYKMVSSGFYSLESVRELIAVPQQIRAELQDDTNRFPSEADEIQVILRFRERVREEFEKLVGVNQLPH